MSEEQFPQNEVNQSNNENKQEEKNFAPSVVHNNENGSINLIKTSQKNEDLKIGQYILTPLQSIFINKKMPPGFKLETEENILKAIDTKNQAKKNKNNAKHKEKMMREGYRNGGFNQNKKRNQNTNNIDNIPSNIPPENIKTHKICKIGIERLKESKYINLYYQSNNPDVPCLAKIEKKVNNYEYKTLYDFSMDIREIWNYNFRLKKDYEITSRMSDEWENICADLENGITSTNNKKRSDEIKNNVMTKENVPAPIKKINQNNEFNKPMTVEEKNKLGNNIRTLNKDQLKGIIRILSEDNPMPKKKYFEFDIDQLPTKKLRELEKYVKECLSSSKNNKSNPTNNTNNNTHNQSLNNKNQNQKENQNNKSANKVANTQNQNQALLKSSNKDTNKNNENKVDQSSAKKIKQSNKKNDISSDDSDSISSESSISN